MPPPTSGVISKFSITTPFSLIPDRAPLQLIPSTPSDVRHGGTFAPFILWLEDVIYRAPRARISIWSLLATSSTHRDALIQALSQIRVETSTTLEGLIHMMTTDRATCIVFSADDLPLKGSDHTRPFYIIVVCSGHRVPSILLDNGSTLNVCPLATAIALGFAPLDFGDQRFSLMLRRWGFEDSTVDELQRMLHQISAQAFLSIGAFLGVSVIEIAEEDPTILAHELPAFVVPTIDMYEGNVGPIEGACNSVDPPLSFDILLGFVTHFDYVSNDSIMDLSIYEYLSVSCDDVLLLSPYSSISQIFDINDEIAQPNLDRDSFDYDSDPIDERVSPAIGDIETVDFGTDDQPRKLKIGLPLSIDEKDRLIHLLKSYLDVFAWSYEDMPSLDPSIVQHHLPILPHARPDGKVRVCVDFRDLNKANPKDDFSLSHIDLLVDSTADHSMLSFMYGFSGDVEVYVDDMIVKSQGADHLAALERFFERIQKFRLRLNPKKCTFGSDFWEIVGSYVPPMPGRPLVLYLSVSDMALGCMLAQLDDLGKERAIYYLKVEHYMIEYSVHLISRLDPLRYLFDRLALASRLMRWLVLLTKFDIQYVSQKCIEGSVVADHLASLPTIESRPVDDDFPDEEFVAMTRSGTYPEAVTAKDQRALRQLSDKREMLRVLDVRGSYSCTTLRVACFDITMAILGEHTLELKSKLCYRNMASNITDHLHTGATPNFLVLWYEVCFASQDRDGFFKSSSRVVDFGDRVGLGMLRGLIGDPREKFIPTWSGPYVIQELTPKEAAWLTNLDEKPIFRAN
ncbi:hypothetical protein CK203_056262 [Vitis vinifera]|uniref:Reverse transcriptase/retrotransposon-derived protein RNase H-like domain-containing protein n=1 Tax=Vitis vinifera TaxID=29760 RepID=A0A438GJJ2_VITVI|nr:hypothetical protein CK203_056262 [Vitis vinifera]